MAYIDDLDLPALRPQLFNSAPPGTMRAQPPAPRDPNAPDAMQSLVDAFHQYIIGAPGSGRVPAPVQGTAGGPDRITGIDPKQLPTAPAIPVNGPTAPGAEAPVAKPPTPRKAGGMPKAAADTGVDANGDPKEGYYLLNGQAIPYGPAGLSMGGNGASGGGAGYAYAGGGAGGGGGLIDPRGNLADVATQQIHYARRASQEILDQAGAPGELGYAARLHALSSVYLNGLAAVGQGGANSFNADLAGMSNEGSRAAASRDVSKNSLTGDLARAAATRYGADRSYDSAAEEHGVQMYRAETDMVPGGTEIGRDANGMSVPLTTYIPRSKVGGMPAPYEQRQAAQKQVGKTYVDKAGNRATYNADGSYTPVK